MNVKQCSVVRDTDNGLGRHCCRWSTDLLAVRKFGKISLDLKNETVPFVHNQQLENCFFCAKESRIIGLIFTKILRDWHSNILHDIVIVPSGTEGVLFA